MDERYQLLETAKDMIPPRAKYTIIGLIAVLVILGTYSVYNYFKPVPAVTPSTAPGQYHFNVNGPTAQQPAPQVIYVTTGVDHQTVTTAGVEAKQKDDPTDMEYRLKTNYFIDINGKKYEVQPEVKEDTKLQNNKIVVTQDGTLNIKVDVPQPVGSFGAGVNSHGALAFVADGRIWKNVNWWVYGSQTEQAAGLKATVYK